MKSHFYLFLLALSVSFLGNAQNITLTPDNAYEGQQLEITAVSSSPLSGVVPGTSGEQFFFYQGQGSSVYNFIFPDYSPSQLNNFTMAGTFTISGSSAGVYNMYFGNGNYFDVVNIFFVNANLQGPGTINGTIVNGTPKTGSGTPYAGLRLYLIDADGDTIAITRTNANGMFEFLYLPYGTYYLHAEGADNSNPVVFVISLINSSYTGTGITYDASSNRLVGVDEIDLFTENALNVYPTVFNGGFDISYTLNTATEVTVEVYAMNGTKVARLVNNEFRPSGSHNHKFDASKYGINAVGMYFVKVSIGSASATIKVIKQ